MADAIEKATTELKSRSGVRVIVIATDGMPDSKNRALKAAQKAKALGIDIIAIGTGDSDGEFLGQIASRSDLAVMVHQTELESGITGAAKMLPRAE